MLTANVRNVQGDSLVHQLTGGTFMPVLDTPITTDDRGLKKVLGQKQPAILVLHHGAMDKPLDDALRKTARKHAGDLLVVRVDVADNPDAHAKYDQPALPALIAMSQAFFGRKEVARAESVRPADVRAYVAHLLEDKPLPKSRSANNGAGSDASDDGVSGKPMVVNDKNFRAKVLKSKEPVLVDFWASWCAPCRMIAPHVEQLAQEYEGKMKVAKLDTDANQATARRYQIQSIPTLMIFENGQPVHRITGANPQALRRAVKQFVE
jgi:thioredoxin 1